MRPLARVLPSVNAAQQALAGENRHCAAVVISHGMGQQVKWQTLSELVQALDGRQLLESSVDPAVRQVEFVHRNETFFLGRAEVTLSGPDGPKPVHLYEAYWAPLTEGKISLKDTLWFLYGAALSGIRRAFRPLYRPDPAGLSGGGEPHEPKPVKEFGHPGIGVVLAFVAAAAIVTALVVMNASITFGALKEFLNNSQAEQPQDQRLLRMLTADLWFFELAVASYLAAMQGVLWYRRRQRARKADFVLPRAVTALASALTVGLALATVAIGMGFIPLHYFDYWTSLDRAPGWTEARVLLAAADLAQQSLAYVPVLRALDALLVHSTLVWGAMILVSYVARRLLVQYVGDVAIYVSHHTVSTFDETRDAVKALVRRTLCAVVESGGYERVVVVGHSLGSVIAYDALNGGVLADEVRRPLPAMTVSPWDHVRRLITFGSPLDKTAYIFRAAGDDEAPVREGLAASVQPLLSRPASSGFDWVNIYSPNDIVSGSLDYYPGVVNTPDPQADTPVWAHVQFWSNAVLAQQLATACTDPFVPGPPSGTYRRPAYASN